MEFSKLNFSLRKSQDLIVFSCYCSRVVLITYTWCVKYTLNNSGDVSLIQIERTTPNQYMPENDCFQV